MKEAFAMRTGLGRAGGLANDRQPEVAHHRIPDASHANVNPKSIDDGSTFQRPEGLPHSIQT